MGIVRSRGAVPHPVTTGGQVRGISECVSGPLHDGVRRTLRDDQGRFHDVLPLVVESRFASVEFSAHMRITYVRPGDEDELAWGCCTAQPVALTDEGFIELAPALSIRGSKVELAVVELDRAVEHDDAP